MDDLLGNPIVIGVLVGMPSFLLGFLGYRRSQQADKASESADAIGHIIDGLNALIDALQDDNRVLRRNADALQLRLSQAATELEKLKRTVATLSGGSA
jgi:ABC-type transporter Mla subunit MlaD